MNSLLRAASAAALLAAVVAVVAAAAAAAAAAPGGRAAADIAYGPDPAQRLDVCEPASSGPHPGLLMIHGGGWQQGDKRAYRELCALAAARGIVAATIDDRPVTGAPGNRLDGQLADVRAAAAWMARNAGRLRLDPARVCVIGRSSGAHEALLLAFDAGAQAAAGIRVACVVDEFGPADLTTLPRPPVRRLFGPEPGSPLSTLERAVSPVFMVRPGAPPVLIVHGTADEAVPIAQSQELQATLQRAGVPVRMVTYDGGHGFRGATREQREAIMRTELDFVASQAPGQR